MGLMMNPVERFSRGRWRRLLIPAGMLYLIGIMEGIEVLRQRRRGARRSLVSSTADRDPRSVKLLALTWWPAGETALVAAAALPGLAARGPWSRRALWTGVVVTGLGIGLRQWAIATLGRYFVGHVVIQPEQEVIGNGPYRWLRHPSYTGFWLEMIGVGISSGNLLSATLCTIVPLIGVRARIVGEERELVAGLPGYGEYSRTRRRLIPFVW